MRSTVDDLSRRLPRLGFAEVEPEAAGLQCDGFAYVRLGANGTSEQALLLRTAGDDEVAPSFLSRSPFGDWIHHDLSTWGLPAVVSRDTEDAFLAGLKRVLYQMDATLQP